MSLILRIAATLVAAILFLPIVTLFTEAGISSDSYFTHLYDTVLFDYLSNSFLVGAGAVSIAVLIGVPLAWWVARFEFPGRRFFNWALVLPLAMPAYIVAYLYTDLFDFSGPVQATLRQIFGWHRPGDYWFFDVRSLGGAVVMLGLVLFPYVYMIMRAAFFEQSPHLRAAAQTLGRSDLNIFWRIHLPVARPALVIAAALVAMEALADFATVNLFAVSTLTTAVYESWLGHGNLATAAKLSCILLLSIFALLGLERYSRRARQGHKQDVQPQKLLPCSPAKGWGISVFATFILIASFLLPLGMLVKDAVVYFSQSWQTEMLQHARSSFVLALVVAILCLGFTLLINLVLRFQSAPVLRWCQGLASMGYAVPGTVMAIGVLIPLGFVDVQVHELMQSLTGTGTGLLFSGTVFAMCYAFVVRFYAIANGSIDAGLGRLSKSLDMAAATLKQSPWQTSRRVHLPLLSSSMLTALLLVFIECVKELPAALLLRPFNFETLATYIYQFASDEQLELAALGALFIVLVGLIPLWIINRNLIKQSYEK